MIDLLYIFGGCAAVAAAHFVLVLLLALSLGAFRSE